MAGIGGAGYAAVVARAGRLQRGVDMNGKSKQTVSREEYRRLDNLVTRTLPTASLANQSSH
ncbi:hypothetical protein AERO9A_510002 [Aeromonas salmonicida]|nr:hypothetical protein AERO9A_510002 [Aeromonas salmonicida]